MRRADQRGDLGFFQLTREETNIIICLRVLQVGAGRSSASSIADVNRGLSLHPAARLLRDASGCTNSIQLFRHLALQTCSEPFSCGLVGKRALRNLNIS